MIVKFDSGGALLSTWLIIQSILSSSQAKIISSSSSQHHHRLIPTRVCTLQEDEKGQRINHLTKPAFIIRGGYSSSRGNGGDYYGYNDYGDNNSHDYNRGGGGGYYGADEEQDKDGSGDYRYDDDRSLNGERYDDYYEDDRYGNSQRQRSSGGYESDYYGDREDDDYKKPSVSHVEHACIFSMHVDYESPNCLMMCVCYSIYLM